MIDPCDAIVSAIDIYIPFPPHDPVDARAFELVRELTERMIVFAIRDKFPSARVTACLGAPKASINLVFGRDVDSPTRDAVIERVGEIAVETIWAQARGIIGAKLRGSEPTKEPGN